MQIEYLQNVEMTLHALRLKYNYSNENQWAKNTKGWREKKEELIDAIIEKTKNKVATKFAKDWSNQFKLWKAIEIQAGAILRKTIGENNEIIRPMNANELASLAGACERALKSQKLLHGEATENTNINNLHSAIVNVIHEVEKTNAGNIT